MKPLLILPPAPARWEMLEPLLGFLEAPARADLRRRLSDGLPDAYDAFAVVPEGRRAVACAAVYRRQDRGVLRYVWTSPEHRRRGYARRLIATLTTWFDMSGGRVLYLRAPLELRDPVLHAAGFTVLHRSGDQGRAVWARGLLPDKPLDAEQVVRRIAAADFPLLVELLQFVPGPDAQMALHDSAVEAEDLVHDLLESAAQGTRIVLAAWQGSRIVAVGGLARETENQGGLVNLIPPNGLPAALQHALIQEARRAGLPEPVFNMANSAVAEAAPTPPAA